MPVQSGAGHPGRTPEDDHGYIIKIIQYLEYEFGIRFFITSRDFDVLYRWWEKQVPLSLVAESIANVVARRRKKGQDISTFASFSYEVRKNFRHLMQMQMASPVLAVDKNDADAIDDFIKNIPVELAGLTGEFRALAESIAKGVEVSVDPLHQALLDLFENDADLNLRTEIFLKNLAEEIRRPDIVRKYRINYLYHRFRIPEFVP